jgi:hypothetical protein
MIVDLDRWLANETEREAEGRVFPHDMFISHRRFDLPNALVETLTAAGVNVVWDCDLDLRDRRVMQGVARAMRRSRFVVLYVSDAYVDSPWCRAEYLNAVWVEDKYKIARAFVICESQRALSRVPEGLSKVPHFFSGEAGCREVATFAISGNLDGNAGAQSLRGRVPAERLAQDVALLSLDEQLNLLEQRILFWNERGLAEINLSRPERAATALSALMSDAITEAEKIFRDVRSIVFVSVASDHCRPGVGAQELKRVVSMVNVVACSYRVPARTAELQGLDKWAYDFLLKPLLLAVELEATRTEAATAYRAMCSALACGAFRHEVPVYLSVLETVESERHDAASAVSSHRVPLYEVAKGRTGA